MQADKLRASKAPVERVIYRSVMLEFIKMIHLISETLLVHAGAEHALHQAFHMQPS